MSSFGSSDSSFVESIGKNKYFKAPGIKYHADGDIVRLPEWDLALESLQGESMGLNSNANADVALTSTFYLFSCLASS